MLLKIERIILRKLAKQPHDFKIDSSAFPKYSGLEINRAMISLEGKGYLKMLSATMEYAVFSYELTTKGRYYREYARKSFVKNILIPFVVALLTTIVTLYLEKLVENDSPTDTSGYTCEYGDDN